MNKNKTKKYNKQFGGDGYSVNIDKNIAGMPQYSRYTDNDEPIFNGSLLQNGGDGYSVNVNEAIGGLPAYPRYSNNYRPVFNGSLLQNGGNKKTNCGCNKKNTSVFDLIKLSGGAKNLNKPTQFSAIKEVSYLMSPLKIESLLSVILYIFLNSFMKTKPVKAKQMGGYVSELSNVLAPLGKNNLIVLASLLLLHYFAVEKDKKAINSDSKLKSKIASGGSNLLTQILAPLGMNALGSSVLLVMIREAFIKTKPQENKTSKKQTGGNPLKNLIAPLGTSAFIATGIIVALEVLFLNKIKDIKSKDDDKKKLIGGKLNESFEKIFNMLSPITFNTFATESFLKKMATNKK